MSVFFFYKKSHTEYNKKLFTMVSLKRNCMIQFIVKEKIRYLASVLSWDVFVTYKIFSSNPPKKTYLSRSLIALLSHGGVPNEYFINILENALQDTHGAFCNKRAALRGVYLLTYQCLDLWNALTVFFLFIYFMFFLWLLPLYLWSVIGIMVLLSYYLNFNFLFNFPNF